MKIETKIIRISHENSHKTLKIITSEKDFRSWNQKQLTEPFSAKSSGRIILQRLMRGIIWQGYEKIRSKKETPIEGNLRTFWYQFVKPVLSHLGAVPFVSF